MIVEDDMDDIMRRIPRPQQTRRRDEQLLSTTAEDSLKLYSFGFAARDFFHDLEIQEAKRWLFFDKFKMALHHDQAANGRSLPALAVFAHALRHLKEQALRELSDQAGADLRPDHIRWV
ncbi:Heat shock 70 kDa protein 12A, partial [Gryllus bimaculatus]